MEQSTIVLRPDGNGLARKVVLESYEDLELLQLEEKVKTDEEAVINAQAIVLSVAHGVVVGSQDVTQLQTAVEAEDKAKAALEDSKSELSVGQELVANAGLSGTEVPAEDGTNGPVETDF